MDLEHENLRRKNDEIILAYREKTKQLLRTQELYDRVKSKEDLGRMQRAASDAVATTLQESSQSLHSLQDRLMPRHHECKEPCPDHLDSRLVQGQRLGTGFSQANTDGAISNPLVERAAWKTYEIPLGESYIRRGPVAGNQPLYVRTNVS
jgi:hypothetical protein